jgi:hypothetical protein
MRFKHVIGIPTLALMCLALCACELAGAVFAQGGTRVSAAPAATPSSPSLITTLAPAPTHTLVLTPSPAPMPTPTPAPDPWADKFYTSGGAYISVKDAVNGPWVYKDARLGVSIQYLRGGPIEGHYYRIEIYMRGEVPYRGFSFQKIAKPNLGRMELPYKIARRYNAVLGITADYYTKEGSKKSTILVGGETYYEKHKYSTLAILPDGNLKAYGPGEITAAELQLMGVKDTFSFGPILVKDGAVDKDAIRKHWLPDSGSSVRAAIGQVEAGHYIAIVTKEGFRMSDLAKLFVDNHCTMAYGMDGGASACVVFMGEQLNPATKTRPQRPMPDLLIFGENASVPGVNDRFYCNGVSIHPQNKPNPTEGIIPATTATPGK